MIEMQMISMLGAKGMLKNVLTASVRAKHETVRKSGEVMAKFWRLTLSGPATARTLGVGTGHLRRSMVRKSLSQDALVVRNIAPYGAAHEYGVNQRVRVRRHDVRSFQRRGSIVQAHFRGPFDRHMRLPERPHMRPAVSLAQPFIRQILQGEMDAAVKGAADQYRLVAAQQKALGKELGASARRTR